MRWPTCNLGSGAAWLGMRPGAEALMRRHLGALGAADAQLSRRLRIPEIEALL